MPNYARPLYTNETAFDFLVEVLEISRTEANDLCTKIMKAELLLKNMRFKPTLESKDHRKPLYSSDESRIILRRRILMS